MWTSAGIAGLCGVLLASPTANAGDWSGYVSAEPRLFLDDPLFADQEPRNLGVSAALAVEWRYEWNDGDDRITLAPYGRWDGDDGERTHADLREANWLHFTGPWTFQVGIGRVFWGVTESRHLVDIVNQIDAVEDIDEEDRLGQPMIAVERFTDIGTFGVWWLPGFRERTFPGAAGRLGGRVFVDGDQAAYESGAGRHRGDIAGRWADTIGEWDLGLSGFHGTSREPRLVPKGNVLAPHYDVITQVGIDAQLTRGAWLWKFEAIRRSGPGYGFAAAVAGFEYTRYGVMGSRADLGILLERLHDGRPDRAPVTVYDDDWFGGLRLAFNDVQGTALLAGWIEDRDCASGIGFVEVERRIGSDWKLEVEARFFDVESDDRALAGFRNDSFVNVRLARFF